MRGRRRRATGLPRGSVAAPLSAAKRALLRAARTRRLLVDASKFRPRTFMQVATLDEIDELICDDGLAVEEADRLRAMGKRLTLVSTS